VIRAADCHFGGSDFAEKSGGKPQVRVAIAISNRVGGVLRFGTAFAFYLCRPLSNANPGTCSFAALAVPAGHVKNFTNRSISR
jgi:hypothetical protein